MKIEFLAKLTAGARRRLLAGVWRQRRLTARPIVVDQLPPFEPPAAPAETGILFVRSHRARRYRLTLRRDGTAVATIPRRGSEQEARRFVEQQRDWLERARGRQRARPRAPEIWTPGTPVLWRGEAQPIRVAADGGRPMVALGGDVFRVRRLDGDLRPALGRSATRTSSSSACSRSGLASSISRLPLIASRSLRRLRRTKSLRARRTASFRFLVLRIAATSRSSSSGMSSVVLMVASAQATSECTKVKHQIVVYEDGASQKM